MAADPYTCIEALAGDARPQGLCQQGYVQVPPTLVVYSAELPPYDALAQVFMIGFVASVCGPQFAAFIIRKVRDLVESL